jgi:hypothetical protein
MIIADLINIFILARYRQQHQHGPELFILIVIIKLLCKQWRASSLYAWEETKTSHGSVADFVLDSDRRNVSLRAFSNV